MYTLLSAVSVFYSKKRKIVRPKLAVPIRPPCGPPTSSSDDIKEHSCTSLHSQVATTWSPPPKSQCKKKSM